MTNDANVDVAVLLSDWSHTTGDVGDAGLTRERSVASDTLSSLAKALNMESLASLTTSYRIAALAGGAYRLHGSVVAKGRQLCVVTLEPLAAQIDESFDVEFWPDLPESSGGEDQSILDDRDVEKLEGGMIPVGRIVFETISAALDPYPRKAGAEFQWAEEQVRSGEATSPFAALAKLKNKP